MFGGDATLLAQENRHAPFRQRQRRRDAGDAATDDDDIDALRQRYPGSVPCGFDPADPLLPRHAMSPSRLLMGDRAG